MVLTEPGRALVVGGRVIGSIRSAGPVVVLEDGYVQGSIRASRITIGGQVLRRVPGDGVVADGELVLTASARLECDAVYEHLSAERGATFAGMLVPFGSDFFYELHSGGRLAFLDALEIPVAPQASQAAGASRAAEAPRVQSASPAVAVTANPPAQSVASTGASGAGEATTLRAVQVAASAEHPYASRRPGEVAFLGTGTNDR